MANATMSILCAITNIDVATFNVSNNIFSLLPINRNVCPEIKPERDISYEVYTRSNKDKPKVLKVYDDDSLKNSGIDFKKPTKIFCHGYMESSKADNAQSIKNSFLKQGDYNIILVDARVLLAGPFYVTSAYNTKPIAKYNAKLIDYLVDKGLKLDDLHVIGMSLGGQIAGMTGQFVTKGKLPRITGLDPAGPLFVGAKEDERIDASDGKYVEIIHTNGLLFGYPQACGHADFWVNGGDVLIQKGCNPLSLITKTFNVFEYVFCSHYLAYRVYAESIINPKGFPAKNCTSWSDYEVGKCDSNPTVYWGEHAIGNKFYVKANGQPPYSPVSQ